MNLIVAVGNFSCNTATICLVRNGEIGYGKSLYTMCTMTLCIVGVSGRRVRFWRRSAHLAPDRLISCILAGGTKSLQQWASLESLSIRLVVSSVMQRLCHWLEVLYPLGRC